MRNIFLYPVEAINGLRTNVWATGLIVMGTVLTLHGHSDAGTALVTGGFALLRVETATSQKDLPNVTQEVKDPNAH